MWNGYRRSASTSRWVIIAITALLITISYTASGQSDSLSILPRSGWGAKAPIKRMIPHTPTRITIHHTGTRQNPNRSLKAKMMALQQYSQSARKLGNGKQKKAWPDIPYHFYVSVAGEIAEGRAVQFSGDTNTDYNPKGHISIVVEGNFNEEIPKSNQISALVKLIALLTNRHKIEVEAVGGHRQHAPTACPGHNLHTVLTKVKRNVVKAQRPVIQPLKIASTFPFGLWFVVGSVLFLVIAII